MSILYSQIQSLEKELADDDAALDWFNLRTSVSEIPSTPLALMPHHLKNKFQG